MLPVRPAVWLSARGVWALLGLSLLLAVASVVPGLAFAVFGGAAIFVALVLADAALGPSARTLAVRRAPLSTVTMRRGARATYEIENRAEIAIRLGLLETPVAALEFAAESLETTVGARSTRAVGIDFFARERGLARFGAIYVWVENRIGLLRRRYRVEASQDVRVVPDLGAVEGYGTLARRHTSIDAGLRRMRRRGAGNEFESLRDYQPDDAFGLVDWKATARRGRLTVAQYEVERSQTVLIALDCGRLMTPRIGSGARAQRKFDYALTAALCVARIAQAAGDNVGLSAFAATSLVRIAPRRGAAHVAALARATYDLQPRPEEPDYETAFADLRARATKRSLVILFTDIFDPVTSAAVLASFGTLAPRHLALCVLMNDGAVADALERVPHDPSGAYRTAVAMTLADERARAIAVLRSRGIIVVDVPAAKLTLALLDAYLDVKARGLL